MDAASDGPTLYVYEDDPLDAIADQAFDDGADDDWRLPPRWHADLDGGPARVFRDPERAVAWGLTHAVTVIVRTLGAVYVAGAEPRSGGWSAEELRPWPPKAGERAAIDVAYAERLAELARERDLRRAYERQRDAWLATGAAPARAIAYRCWLPLPGDDRMVELEELAADGSVCGARLQRSDALGFGTLAQAVASTIGRTESDPWVAAVCAALAREHRGEVPRRQRLDVFLGDGELFHVSAAANRESIARHGLDWRRMGAAAGVAGSPTPEVAAIFLADDWSVDFFLQMAYKVSDVWAVDVTGLWLEGGPDGWYIVPQPIPASRLRLARTDVPGGWSP
jgi:hypothetical protein